jgi:phage tail-like protein
MGIRGEKLDPLRNFKFKVTASTRDIEAGFSRASGLKEQTEVVEYREGTDPARMRKLPGQASYDNVVLERGLTTSTTLLTWRQQVKTATAGAGQDLSAEGIAGPSGQGDIYDEIQIYLGDYHGRQQWQWDLVMAWPASLETGEFTGDGNDVVLETVEFAHEGIRYTSPGG